MERARNGALRCNGNGFVRRDLPEEWKYIISQLFEENTTKLLNNQKTQGFYWLESFSDLLTVYADSRAEYKTIRDFMPQIVEFYRELAK